MEAPGRRPLKAGLVLTPWDDSASGTARRWTDLLATARRAEAAGFDSVCGPAPLTFRWPGREDEPQGIWEGWSLLAALAAATDRIEIGSLVTCTVFRHPALLAKIADTIDEVSGGRLILGLGAGWHEPEYRAFGFPFDHRVSRFEEALAIIAGLLREGRVDFEGTYYQARDCELRPRGPRPQGPPILVGGYGERMLRLTARHADAWNAWFSETGNRVENLAPLRAAADAACVAVGRDPSSLERTVAVNVEVGPHAPSTMSAPPLTGTPEELAAGLRAYADAGISHAQVWLEPNTLVGIEAFSRVLELLDHV